ncbi:MAG: hypothetical protein C0490_15975, partial [Marivirga sp.]|nr:hypothetical protein [Marivirga sp.]
SSLKEFLNAIFEDAATNNFGGRGCFFYNCLGTKENLNKNYQRTLENAYIRVRNIFERRIVSVKNNIDSETVTDITGYATLLMATIAGLRALNLSGLPKDDLICAANFARRTFPI